jgi:drug/metabolite transporter (DMT)-like permease
MHIVDTLKFAFGIVFILIGLAMLFQQRGRRGFGQKRQLGVLLILGGAVFVALGLGIDVKAMIGL